MTAQVIHLNKPRLQKPSRPLGKHGQALWQSIVTEYGIEDAGGVEMLTMACQSLDRAEELAAAIKEDGAVIRTRGIVKEHPGIKAELANRSFVVRTLQRLGLDVEALKSVGRPPASGGWNPEED
jgi:hypothetical protein